MYAVFGNFRDRGCGVLYTFLGASGSKYHTGSWSESVFLQLKDADGNCSGIRAIDLFSGIEGPAGGRIIYDNDSAGADGWRFIEISPGMVDQTSTSGDTPEFTFSNTPDSFRMGYYRTDPYGPNLFVNGTETYNEYDCTRSGIGEGKRNTELLVEMRAGNVYSEKEGGYLVDVSIAEAVYHAEINGYDDWYLPSVDETLLFPERISRIISSTERDVESCWVLNSGSITFDMNISFGSPYGIRYF